MRKIIFCILCVASALPVIAQNTIKNIPDSNRFLKGVSKTKHYAVKKVDRKKLLWDNEDIYGG